MLQEKGPSLAFQHPSRPANLAIFAVFQRTCAENRVVNNLTDEAQARGTYMQQNLRDDGQVVFLLRDLIETDALSEKAAGACRWPA